MSEKTDWVRLISKNWDKYYPLYIQSAEWIKKRKAVLKRDGYLCICGSRAEIVHHKNYKHIGNEKLFELVSFCEYCHEYIHTRRNEYKN